MRGRREKKAWQNHVFAANRGEADPSMDAGAANWKVGRITDHLNMTMTTFEPAEQGPTYPQSNYP
jgi:hypothetical protein